MLKKMLIILNPSSGMKLGKRHLADILDVFCREGYSCNVYITTAREDATNHILNISEQYETIVCIGGDGTFNEVISGVVKKGLSCDIGYIPAGSTNDFANSLKLSKNLVNAAKDIAKGLPYTYDIGQFNDRYFSYVASFGAFTRASYATPQNIKNALGHLAYILAGIKEITNIRPEHLRIQINGDTFEDDYIFGAVCNSTSVGGILTLDPAVVDMNDGLFELLLIKSPKSIFELNEVITALTSQKYDSKMITFCDASEISIHTDNELVWTLDGEMYQSGKEIKIMNIHNAINLLKK